MLSETLQSIFKLQKTNCSQNRKPQIKDYRYKCVARESRSYSKNKLSIYSVYFNQKVLDLYLTSLPYQGLIRIKGVGKVLFSLSQFQLSSAFFNKFSSLDKDNPRITCQFTLGKHLNSYDFSAARVWLVKFFLLDNHTVFKLSFNDIDLTKCVNDFIGEEKNFFQIFLQDNSISKSEIIRNFHIIAKKCIFRRGYTGNKIEIELRRRRVLTNTNQQEEYESLIERDSKDHKLKEYLKPVTINDRNSKIFEQNALLKINTNERKIIFQTSKRIENTFCLITIFYHISQSKLISLNSFLGLWKIKLYFPSTGRSFLGQIDSDEVEFLIQEARLKNPNILNAQKKKPGGRKGSISQSKEGMGKYALRSVKTKDTFSVCNPLDESLKSKHRERESRTSQEISEENLALHNKYIEKSLEIKEKHLAKVKTRSYLESIKPPNPKSRKNADFEKIENKKSETQLNQYKNQWVSASKEIVPSYLRRMVDSSENQINYNTLPHSLKREQQRSGISNAYVKQVLKSSSKKTRISQKHISTFNSQDFNQVSVIFS